MKESGVAFFSFISKTKHTQNGATNLSAMFSNNIKSTQLGARDTKRQLDWLGREAMHLRDSHSYGRSTEYCAAVPPA